MIGVVAPLQVAAAVLLGSAAAQPFQPGSKLAPLGSLRTSDYDGPYNISLLSTQVRIQLRVQCVCVETAAAAKHCSNKQL